ncbi:MAG: CoA transferase [Myxococcales bacterium]|nr:CoA transferase [Myxococcales bacterium]
MDGITLLDLSRVLAGPYCTMLLAELGARVIKVERPDGGDDARAFGPHVDGQSGYFASVNRGKQSLALDLKAPADRALFERLLGRADVLVENYRPGALARLGYDWATLHARWPRLIYGAVSGFGHTGPDRHKPAYDMIVQGMGGLMSVTGEPGRPPVRVGTSVGDITAGLFLSNGLLAALYQRERTGQGVFVDVAMLDGQIAILENAIARYFATGQAPGPLGARHPAITPFGAFKAADGHLTLACGNDALFASLCAVLGAADLAADPRFADNPGRTAHADALQAALEAHLAKRPVAEWLPLLDAAGVPCGPIHDVGQAVHHPQVQARHMVVRAGGLKMAGNPIKISGMPDPTERPAAPALDGDRAAILAWLEETP